MIPGHGPPDSILEGQFAQVRPVGEEGESQTYSLSPWVQIHSASGRSITALGSTFTRRRCRFRRCRSSSRPGSAPASGDPPAPAASTRAPAGRRPASIRELSTSRSLRGSFGPSALRMTGGSIIRGSPYSPARATSTGRVARGKSTVNVVPWPGALVARMFPPSCRTMP